MERETLAEWVEGALILALATRRTSAARCATQFKLSNGMQVVVIPDHRAPIVTHMVWYKAGSADDPLGFSGAAVLVEHLTFKSMDKTVDISRTIARLGGRQNAFCTKDATVYWQRVSKHNLETVMEIEAERMANLNITDEDVAIVRDVMLEGRQAGDSPSARLHDKILAALYRSHPYRIPDIGWSSEIARLTRKDAMRFFKSHYAPNNAILIVSGDATPEEAGRLAEETYGKLPASALEIGRTRPHAFGQIVDHNVRLNEPRAGADSFRRYYAVPSYGTAPPGDAEALELLVKILVGGTGSRLHRKLVIDEKLATSVQGRYNCDSIQAGLITLSVAPNCTDLRIVEDAVDNVLEDVRKNGVTRMELGRAKRWLIATHILDCDSQELLARSYGSAVVVGRTIEDFEDWPATISRVTTADVLRVANEYIDPVRSVSGYLTCEADS
jgi:zinc protease